MRAIKLIAALALAATLTGCDTSTDELFVSVSQATEAALPAAFAEFQFEHHAHASSPTPALMFEGRNSVILSVSEPNLRGAIFKEVQLDVLARSQGGRYFTVTYVSDVTSPNKLSFFDVSCVEATCRHLSGGRMLSSDEAKNWFFHDKKFTPERFKAIFGEDAPPQRVPA